MVYYINKTYICSSQLGIWPGLDYPIFSDGYILYIIWTSEFKSKTRRDFFIVFGIQLVLNAMWSFLFFGLRLPLLGLVDILLLDIIVLISINYAKSISKVAAILLVPYLVWIVVAS